jgi:hypothetical protein
MFSLTAGFLVMKNEWLSDEDWDEFLKKVHRNKEAA